MKGHMQDGKFHPHTEYKKGTRKSRDQQVRTEGVKIERKARDPNDVFKRRHLAKVIPKLNNEQIAWIYDKVRFLEMNDLKTYKEADDLEENFWKPSSERKARDQQTKSEGVKIRKKHDEMPLPILETGLDDIFDDVRQTDPEFVKRYGDDKIDDSKLTKAVGDNINYILKREKRLKNDEHISVGNINFREETEDDSGHYQYDYSVWKNNPRTLTNKGGTAYGMISNGTLIDMKLELFNTDKMP